MYFVISSHVEAVVVDPASVVVTSAVVVVTVVGASVVLVVPSVDVVGCTVDGVVGSRVDVDGRTVVDAVVSESSVVLVEQDIPTNVADTI